MISRKKVQKLHGYELRYEFLYDEKPLTFIFAMNRPGLYGTDGYLEKADLIIWHDSIVGDDLVNPFLARLDALSQNPSAKKRFLLTENLWDCDTKADSCRLNQNTYPIKHFNGFYGCTEDQGLWWEGKGYPLYQVETNPQDETTIHWLEPGEPRDNTLGGLRSEATDMIHVPPEDSSKPGFIPGSRFYTSNSALLIEIPPRTSP